MELYEEAYFANDTPVPFVGDLKIYPALVKDYHKFYELISCFTMDKNNAPDGIGLSMSELGYIAYLFKEDSSGMFQQRFFDLLSMVFHIKNGLFCNEPDCPEREKVVSFEDIKKKVRLLDLELQKKYDIKQEEEKELFLKERQQGLYNLQLCPHCHKVMQDVFSLKEENKKPILYVKNIAIKSKDYKDLRRIYAYQNIFDYDDEYIDPELKKGLEEAARLRNKNAVQPTLERQKVCVVVGTGLDFKQVDELTLRKFTLTLRVVAAKVDYLASKIGECTGLVTFKTPIPHWIYSNDKAKDHKFDNVMTFEQIESKIGKGNHVE